jgi:hypothetical protein
MPALIAARFRASWIVLALVLSACNGTAVVTLTSTPSTDNFLAYRVGLTSLELKTSSGSSTLKVLPKATTVDFVNLQNFSEVLAAAGVAKGTYTSAVMTLDYSNAQIVYDDGSLNGEALTPLNSSGQPAGQMSVTATLDTTAPFRIAVKQSAELAIVFSLGASNLVNTTHKTVTVTPLVGASSMPIDAKLVRIRGPVIGVDTTDLIYTSGVEPFDQSVAGLGQLAITQSDTTTYEINGQPSVGSAGLTSLASLSGGALALSYGTLTAADTVTTTTTTTTSSSDVTFLATQVLAGSSLQSSAIDRITGVVSARSGNTLSVEDATLVAADGTNTFIPGATLVTVGPNTIVTVFGETTEQFFTAQQVSVGAVIAAFGTATTTSSGTATLDASAGRIQVDLTTVSGIVTEVDSTGFILNLASLGGRSIAAFNFDGSGAVPSQYSATGVSSDGTGVLELTTATVGGPVEFSGFTSAFGAAAPNFTATAPPVTANTPAGTLVDPTIIQAELVIDWGSGTATPFVTFDSSAMDLDVHNTAIGQRHLVQIGAQRVDITTLSQDPLITPNGNATAQLFSIGHAVSSTVENFNTYDAFITQLQTELNGTTLATGMTASGTYTVSGSAFAATAITLFLNN